MTAPMPEPVQGDVEGVVELAQALGAARKRTLALVAPLSEQQLQATFAALMSPLVWDLGHIAALEEVDVNQRGRGSKQLYDPPHLGRQTSASRRSVAVDGEPNGTASEEIEEQFMHGWTTGADANAQDSTTARRKVSARHSGQGRSPKKRSTQRNRRTIAAG